jgi:hypothetical protein
MKQFHLHRDGWLEGRLDDPDEARTFTRLAISVGDLLLTRNLSSRDGGDSDAINVPLLPLAQAIADMWWVLLYEPFRSGAGPEFKARHRLDVPMHGYVFPQLALCSGGAESLLTAWAHGQEHSRIEFLAPPSINPEILARDQVENVLIDVVEAVLARLDSKGRAHEGLATAWDRVRASISDDDELAYCKASGRLGLDPYNPVSPDLTKFMSQVSETVFEDISDAAFVEELLETTKWLGEARPKWRKASTVDISAFGDFIPDQLELAPWQVGYKAADILRANTGFDQKTPRKHLEDLLGEVLLAKSSSFATAPASISALIARQDDIATVATVARSAREQRFKACTAAYIAWAAKPGEDRAATAAFTRRQQASRSFAAELLAPRDYLRHRAPSHGFTSDNIHRIASDLVCPYETVLWQAFHAGVALRGIELPAPQQVAIV